MLSFLSPLLPKRFPVSSAGAALRGFSKAPFSVLFSELYACAARSLSTNLRFSESTLQCDLERKTGSFLSSSLR